MSHGKLVDLSTRISRMRTEVPTTHSLLVGISGIDASGKGYVAKRIREELQSRSINTALINVDGWMHLPKVRFGGDNPGEHFYHHSLRLNEMFERLILPLKRDRSIRLTADLIEETSVQYHPFEYCFENVDVILLEGIFIFKKTYLEYFDLKVWIECSFEVALRRAISRSQEGLSRARTIRAYENTYFPAQRIHLQMDKPHSAADAIYRNG